MPPSPIHTASGVPPSTDSARSWPVIFAIGVTFACHLILLPLLTDAAGLIGFVSCGVLAAQFGFLAGMHVFAPGSLGSRTICAWGSFGVLILALSSLGSLGRHDEDGEWGPEFFRLIYTCLLVIAAAEGPLWLMRMVLGWRLTHAVDQDDRPTSIANLLTAMGIISLILAIPHIFRQQMQLGEDFWPTVAVVCSFALGSSVTLLLPVPWLVLRCRTIVPAVIYAVSFSIFATFLAWTFGTRLQIFNLSNAPTTLDWSVLAGVSVFGLLVGYEFLHIYGWRLTTWRERAIALNKLQETT